MKILPRTKTPELAFDTIHHGRWELAAQQPENFTILVFYRGFH